MDLVPVSSIVSPKEDLDEGIKEIMRRARKAASTAKTAAKGAIKGAISGATKALRDKKEAERAHAAQQKRQAVQKRAQAAVHKADGSADGQRQKPKPVATTPATKSTVQKKTQGTGKQEPTGTKSKASAGGKAPHDMVPAQLRHCMLALKHKRGKSTKAAWNICRWSLTKHGYMKGPYRVNTKLPKAVKQTQKGSRRSFAHGMEKGPLGGGIPGTGATKYRKFNKMFKEIEKDVVKKGRS